MARINVDDSWFLDAAGKRQKLIALFTENGCDFPIWSADGMALSAWRLAQHYWLKGRKLIPEDVFQDANLNPMIAVGLAEMVGDEVFVHGIDERSEWMVKRRAAGRLGGKKSVESRRSKYGSAAPLGGPNPPESLEAAPKQTRSKSKQIEAKASKSKPLTLTLYDENIATAQETSSTNLPVPASGPEPFEVESRIADPKRGTDVWAAYAGAYLARYGVQPVRNAKTNRQCQELVKRLGGDGACAVARFYLTHNRDFYVAKSHDIGLCLSDAESLHTQMMRGSRVTRTQAAMTDRTQNNIEVARRVAAQMEEDRNEKLRRSNFGPTGGSGGTDG